MVEYDQLEPVIAPGIGILGADHPLKGRPDSAD